MTLREALTRAASQLHPNPELRADALRDAALLLRHSLGISHATLLAQPERTITREQQTAFQAMIQRRVRNEPIQYITGEQEFYSLALRVTPAVLIPRPETEHLVEAVRAELQPADLSGEALRLVDVGTGSGAIAIALASALPHGQITAVDVSSAALAVAAENAARHSVDARIRFVLSDLLAALEKDGPFDAIVSNPPYIPEAERASLHPQVRDYEPAVALFGGASGLEVYRRLIPAARLALRPAGLLALEFGHGQREPIRDLLAGWTAVRFIDDLAGIPRVALARAPV